jgi:hypothetical protein
MEDIDAIASLQNRARLLLPPQRPGKKVGQYNGQRLLLCAKTLYALSVTPGYGGGTDSESRTVLRNNSALSRLGFHWLDVNTS